MTEDTPRLLVEGGPVHRRVNHVLALLIGVVIGGGLGLGALTVISIRASNDAHEAVTEVKSSRVAAVRIACEEANQRHRTAATGLAALAARTAPKNPTLAEAKTRSKVLDAFVNALAPAYLAGSTALPSAEREHLGCALRIAELTSP